MKKQEILNFTLIHKTKRKVFIQNSLGPDDFTSKFYKCTYF